MKTFIDSSDFTSDFAVSRDFQRAYLNSDIELVDKALEALYAVQASEPNSGIGSGTLDKIVYLEVANQVNKLKLEALDLR